MDNHFKLPVTVILKAGLLVGSLDILAAFIDYYIATGKGPAGVLKFIASGVFGMEAFSGGTSTILLGLLFHFVIAFAFTIFYFWLYSTVKFVGQQPVIFAVLYAIFMWVATHLVMMPLSNVPLNGRTDLQFWKIAMANLILIFMICVPLILMARKYDEQQSISGNKLAQLLL